MRAEINPVYDRNNARLAKQSPSSSQTCSLLRSHASYGSALISYKLTWMTKITVLAASQLTLEIFNQQGRSVICKSRLHGARPSVNATRLRNAAHCYCNATPPLHLLDILTLDMAANPILIKIDNAGNVILSTIATEPLSSKELLVSPKLYRWHQSHLL